MVKTIGNKWSLIPVINNCCQWQNFGRHWYAIATIGRTPNTRIVEIQSRSTDAKNSSKSLSLQSLANSFASLIAFFLIKLVSFSSRYLANCVAFFVIILEMILVCRLYCGQQINMIVLILKQNVK